MRVVGLISGTSADGVEAAVVEINGAPSSLNWRLLKHLHVDHSQTLRDEIFACVRPETGTVDRLCALNFAIGEAFASAALRAIQAAGLSPAQIDFIGSHGQTVWHIPSGANASTLQLGEPAVIAERTGITTISNFRTRDMAAGGQGAPLVAYVDVLLLSHPTFTRAAQNIGGIANVTFLAPLKSAGAEEQRSGGEQQHSPSLPHSPAPLQPFAFDNGPGNMLIDDAAHRATNGASSFDCDGELAKRGRVDENLLKELMAEPYLKLAPPKTTGRELFNLEYGEHIWKRGLARGLHSEDIVATVTAFTAESIAQSYRDFLPATPGEVIVSGGGARNPTLLAMLREKLSPARVITSDEMGLPVEAKEAIAFAILAYETAHGRAGNLPSATGARREVILGSITPGGGAEVQGSKGETLSLTEAINFATKEIDAMSTIEILRVINREDAQIAPAVANELPKVATAVDAIAARMRAGGRLIYVGAGTSGRLGVLDAAEMPPTFNTPPEMVIGIIAGGRDAMFHAIEGAEDSADLGRTEIARLDVTRNDSVVGIAASGRTPFVIGALTEAKRRGALTISIACNRPAPIQDIAEISIAPLVGPEVITGSTRMKAGTAQKIVLNMISTGVMIRLGKTFGNLMVDVQPTNTKLRDRARRIVEAACHLSRADAEKLLRECDGEVKTAIVAHLAHVSTSEARRRLQAVHGSARLALTSSA